MIDPVRGMVEALLALQDLMDAIDIDTMHCSGVEVDYRHQAIHDAYCVLESYKDILKTEPFVAYVNKAQEEMN